MYSPGPGNLGTSSLKVLLQLNCDPRLVKSCIKKLPLASISYILPLVLTVREHSEASGFGPDNQGE